MQFTQENNPFEYSSTEQAELLEYVSSLMNHDDSNLMLRNGVDFDKCVMYLANAWTRYVNGEQEARDEIHSVQHKLVISTVGAIANHLTDKEWDEWTDFVNVELGNLRSFNGSFLGLLWHRQQISDDMADILNVFSWYFSIYYVIANKAYQAIRPRIIVDKSSDAFISSNQIMTMLQMNMISFVKRFNLNKNHMDFVALGFEILAKQPQDTMSNWSNYYDSINHQAVDDFLEDASFKVA